jgi:hypothetical protein
VANELAVAQQKEILNELGTAKVLKQLRMDI